MGTCIEHEKFKAVIVLPPRHELVTLDVTFPDASILPAKDVRPIFWGKFSVPGKNGDGVLKKLDVQASLGTKLNILAERSCIFNVVHSPRLRFA